MRYSDRRARNAAIFADTRRRMEEDSALAAAVEKSLREQRLIPEGEALPGHGGERRYGEALGLEVSQRRSLEAAAGHTGSRVCVLNFASASNPGGGVVNGASAQEESLCRCSTLYPCLNTPALWEGFYRPHREAGDPLHNDDCVYTPGVVVFKSDTDEPALLPEGERFTVDILTCAAPNLRNLPSNPMNPGDGVKGVRPGEAELRRIHEKRFRRILDVAAEQGAEALILGAFGCGAFRNPPELVSAALRRVLEDYRYCFRGVELAVYCTPGHEENYRAFARAFADW